MEASHSSQWALGTRSELSMLVQSVIAGSHSPLVQIAQGSVHEGLMRVQRRLGRRIFPRAVFHTTPVLFHARGRVHGPLAVGSLQSDLAGHRAHRGRTRERREASSAVSPELRPLLHQTQVWQALGSSPHPSARTSPQFRRNFRPKPGTLIYDLLHQVCATWPAIALGVFNTGWQGLRLQTG